MNLQRDLEENRGVKRGERGEKMKGGSEVLEEENEGSGEGGVWTW